MKQDQEVLTLSDYDQCALETQLLKGDCHLMRIDDRPSSRWAVKSVFRVKSSLKGFRRLYRIFHYTL